MNEPIKTNNNTPTKPDVIRYAQELSHSADLLAALATACLNAGSNPCGFNATRQKAAIDRVFEDIADLYRKLEIRDSIIKGLLKALNKSESAI